MECFEIRLPEHATLVGRTARGEPAKVYPGEYLVHLLRSKAPSMAPAVLRFVGADAAGRDVHVPLSLPNDPGDVPGAPGRGADPRLLQVGLHGLPANIEAMTPASIKRSLPVTNPASSPSR